MKPAPATPDRSRRTELQLWLEEANADVVRLQAEIDPLLRSLEAAQQRVELLRRLDALERDEDGADASLKGPTPAPTSLSRAAGSPPGSLEDAVEQVLAAHSEPMHIGDIRAALLALGVALPGRGEDANVIVRIRKYPERFTWVGRGTYALAAWGLPSMEMKRRKRQSKKRKLV